ncbi:phage terminase GpA [Clostridium aceticum]|uniref:Phage terminase GpA n=1 Tax=Clostridium aceticum TaxID=84022 RepID=A0A0D8IC82_9CLOT|nr:phage terminase large subunit family protein [Clostridium aceticum]AKL95004.1 phage terminase GpA [Clostridium aceticum]KJF27905.1 terminase [Clostridium aceticum]
MLRRKKTSRKIKSKTIKVFENIVKIMAPPPKLLVSEWADTYRKLSPESSAEPGQWRTDRAPYQKEIMDALNQPTVETIVIMSSSQVGKTEIINNIIGYYIDYDPAPILLLMPTLDLAQTYSKKRLATMLRDTPALRGKVKDSKSRDSDNTLLEKGFPGGYIALVGANSPTGLSSRPIRILLADEVDRFPASAGSEGDPLSLAEKRTKTFWNKKKVFVSTPTEKGISRIESEYEGSSKEEWCLPCPLCGRHQPLKWAQIKFEDTTMECKFCRERFTEFEWKAGKGKWVAQDEDKIKTKRGFHLNALASPWERWETIIKEFKDAKAKGREALKTFVNTYLGESWEDLEGEVNDEEALIKRRERYGCPVPEGVLLLTAGVDVQDDRLEVEVVGWGVGKESWGIEYKIFYGDPGQDFVWNELDQYLMHEWSFGNGEDVGISCVCIDSGGHYTNEVYKFCKAREHRRIFAIKGYGGSDKAFIGKPSRSNREKVALFPLGVDKGKELIISRIKVAFEGPGYCHYPIEQEKGYNEEYFKGLCSERRVIRYSKGRPKIEWIKKSGVRNEPLDLRNYAGAALEILNPNFEILQKMYKKGKISDQSKSLQGSAKKKRRTISKGV